MFVELHLFSLLYLVALFFIFQITNQLEDSDKILTRLVALLPSCSVLPVQTFSSHAGIKKPSLLYESLLDSDFRGFSNSTPDTTVILLNWSRLSNIKLICSVLCGPLLNDIVAEIFVWNNNPNLSLSYEVIGLHFTTLYSILNWLLL